MNPRLPACQANASTTPTCLMKVKNICFCSTNQLPAGSNGKFFQFGKKSINGPSSILVLLQQLLPSYWNMLEYIQMLFYP